MVMLTRQRNDEPLGDDPHRARAIVDQAVLDAQRRASVAFQDMRPHVARATHLPIDLRALAELPLDPLDIATMLGRSMAELASSLDLPASRTALTIGDQILVWQALVALSTQLTDALIVTLVEQLARVLTSRVVAQRMDRETRAHLRSLLTPAAQAKIDRDSARTTPRRPRGSGGRSMPLPTSPAGGGCRSPSNCAR